LSFSVLLSVYEKEKPEFFNQAFESIWDEQTLKPDQIVLVKDGPLPYDLCIEISRWQGKLKDVLSIVELSENVGLGAALNAGIEACNYDFIARMDTDDISLPNRFEKQVAFMKAHPDIVASSAVLEEWSKDLSQKIGVRLLPTCPFLIANFSKRRSPLSHPLVIFRKSIVTEVGGYPPLRKAQDYGLWSLLLIRGYKLANLSDTLLKMRTGTELHSRRGIVFLKHELALLRFQKKIGFLSYSQFITNFLLKAALRLSPVFIKKIAYRYLR